MADDANVFGGELHVFNAITGDLDVNGLCVLVDTKGTAPNATRVNNNGVLDATGLQHTLTMAPEINGGGGFIDPHRNITGVIDLVNCGVEDLKVFDIGKNMRLTRANL